VLPLVRGILGLAGSVRWSGAGVVDEVGGAVVVAPQVGPGVGLATCHCQGLDPVVQADHGAWLPMRDCLMPAADLCVVQAMVWSICIARMVLAP